MKRSVRILKSYLMIAVVLLAANSAFAQFGDAFGFSFFTRFMNQVFLAPLLLAGCLG